MDKVLYNEAMQFNRIDEIQQVKPVSGRPSKVPKALVEQNEDKKVKPVKNFLYTK